LISSRCIKTIQLSGEFGELVLWSGELVGGALTQKILASIRMIRFEAEQVQTRRANYSFDFLPS